MADFAFKSGGTGPSHDDDVLQSRHHAVKLRAALKEAGHDAHVEHSGGREHRVWIQHPEHKNWAAYVNREEAPRVTQNEWKPYWIEK